MTDYLAADMLAADIVTVCTATHNILRPGELEAATGRLLTFAGNISAIRDTETTGR